MTYMYIYEVLPKHTDILPGVPRLIAAYAWLCFGQQVDMGSAVRPRGCAA